jgi:hypothetical protein
MALAVSATAIAVAAFTHKRADRTPSTVVLTVAGQRSVAEACGRRVPSTLKADVVDDSVDAFYVELVLPANACSSSDDRTKIKVRRDMITSVVSLAD